MHSDSAPRTRWQPRSACQRALFFPAMNAKTFNPLLREFAERLKANGKTGKQIVIGVMRKLLHQIFGMLKSGQPFDLTRRGKTNPQTHSKRHC